VPGELFFAYSITTALKEQGQVFYSSSLVTQVTSDLNRVNIYLAPSIYNRKKGNGNWKEEYVILDLKGNIVKKVFLPYVKNNLMSFKNGIFYYLDRKEYEDDEEWELYYEEIE
jgi:hypothetical protein